MIRSYVVLCAAFCASLVMCPRLDAADVYLNKDNISVSLGAGMPADPFEGSATPAAVLARIINASSAAATETHMSTTHIWVSGQSLNLVFDLKNNYNLKKFHFWNYGGETFDVDTIILSFYDAQNVLIGTQPTISPDLGSDPTVSAQNFNISYANVRYVRATLGGTNNEVDFMNMGFTGEPVPCAVDFNNVNGVTVQDIFDFLTAWLAGSASANFNGVNGVTVQDIFDFLTAWLAGC